MRLQSVRSYLLRIDEILLKAKDQKVKNQEKDRFEEAKQIERKRSIESASLKAAKNQCRPHHHNLTLT